MAGSGMVFSDPAEERLQLNESKVWAGGPYRNDNPEAKEAWPKIRELIDQERWAEAQRLARESMLSRTAQGMPFQTCGNVLLSLPGHERYGDFRRELDLQHAVVTTNYALNGVTHTRVVFASFDANAILLRLSANAPGQISAGHPHRFEATSEQ